MGNHVKDLRWSGEVLEDVDDRIQMVDNQLGRGEDEGDEEDEQVGQNLFDQQPFPPAPQKY